MIQETIRHFVAIRVPVERKRFEIVASAADYDNFIAHWGQRGEPVKL